MARYTATNRPPTYPAEERRRKRQALQTRAGQGRGGGFVAPQQAGLTAQQPAQRPPGRLSQLAQFASAGAGLGLNNQQMQGMLNQQYGPASRSGRQQQGGWQTGGGRALSGIGIPAPQQTWGQPQRRYGQQQGMGGGYQPPRRAIGGFQQPYGMQRYNPNQMGYAPRTAGMYGGRPSTPMEGGTRWSSGPSAWGPGGEQAAYAQAQRQWGQQGYGNWQQMQYQRRQAGLGPAQTGNPNAPNFVMGGGLAPSSGYGYGMNQQQAMMRPQYSYGAQVRQPWGGYNAVPRQNPYQQYRGW